MNRFLYLVLALSLLVSFNACKSNSENSPEPAPNPSKPTSATQDTTTAQEPPAAVGEADTESQGGPAPQGFDGFQKASAQQLEFLQGAIDQLSKNDFDNGVLFLLALKDTPEASLEQMIGLQLLGELYRTRSEPEKGLKYLLEAESRFPPTGEYKGSLAELYAATGENEKALTYLRASLALKPDQLKYQVALVEQLKTTHDATLPEAMVAYQKALTDHLALLKKPDASAEELSQALAPLAEFRDPRATAALLSLLEHPKQQVVAEAIYTLIKSGNKAALEPLKALREKQTDPKLQAAISQAITILEGMSEAEIKSVPEITP